MMSMFFQEKIVEKDVVVLANALSAADRDVMEKQYGGAECIFTGAVVPASVASTSSSSSSSSPTDTGAGAGDAVEQEKTTAGNRFRILAGDCEVIVNLFILQ